MDNNIDHPLTLTVEQAAKLLGIGRSTAYELVNTGEIPSIRLGRRIVVPLGQIAECLSVDRDVVWATLTDATVEPPAPQTHEPSGNTSRAQLVTTTETTTLF